ncbi:pectinesterase-like isoform X1 [Momordica charantia]|uniref:Pectinesterase-like isoform X1 n=1 Tax=Momordica charantia TaxID=3673 RepID=A0A6J1DQ60_MOMCH|nr:pectinesterase-like isoform X1 [Momordica charantia]
MDLVTYKSISDGIAAPDNGDTRFYIRVTSRIYHEHIEILYAKKFIALIGDNISTTIIVDNQSTGFGTAETATLTKYITFENSAGSENGQGVAFFNNANQAVYYKCTFSLGFKIHFLYKTRYSSKIAKFMEQSYIWW